MNKIWNTCIVCGDFVPRTPSFSYQGSMMTKLMFYLFSKWTSADVWIPGRGDPVDPSCLRRQQRRRSMDGFGSVRK